MLLLVLLGMLVGRAAAESATVFVTFDKSMADDPRIQKVLRALETERFRVVEMAAEVHTYKMETRVVIRKELAPELKKDIRDTISKAWCSTLLIEESKGPLSSERSGVVYCKGVVAEVFLFGIGKQPSSSADMGDTNVAAILEELRNADYKSSVSLCARLVKIGKPAVPLLIRMVKNKDEPIAARKNAATTLGLIGDSSAIEPLIELYNNSSGGEQTGIHMAAMEALVRIYGNGKLDAASIGKIKTALPFLAK